LVIEQVPAGKEAFPLVNAKVIVKILGSYKNGGSNKKKWVCFCMKRSMTARLFVARNGVCPAKGRQDEMYNQLIPVV
jgi:hypothetical protein